MKIGICSDTHDHIRHTKNAVSVFKQNRAEVVIHAGDYCSPFMIPLFDELNLHGIFGNNDGDRFLLMKKFEKIGATLHGDFASLNEGGLKIAVYHGTYPEITQSLQKGGIFDVVISGHTHQGKVGMEEDTLCINPGSVNGFDGDALVALLDTNTRQVQFVEL